MKEIKTTKLLVKAAKLLVKAAKLLVKVVIFLLGECAVIALLGIYIYWQYLTPFPGLTPKIYVNGLNLIPITGMLLLIMAVTGSFKDLGCAFKYCVMSDDNASVNQVRKAIYAVKLAMITAALTGGIITLLNIITVYRTSINLFATEERLYEAGPDQILIAGSMTDMVCGLSVVFLLLPIYGRLKKMTLTNHPSTSKNSINME